MHFRLTFCVVALGFCVAYGGTGEPKSKDAKNIQGTWKVVSLTMEGQERKGDDIKDLWFKISATEIAIVQGESNVLPPRAYSIDAAKMPKHIDIVDHIYLNRKPDKDAKDKPTKIKEKLVMPGIYELDGDTLKICWNGEGVPSPKLERPKEFKVAGDLSLVVLKRYK